MKEWLTKKIESEKNVLLLAFLLPFGIMLSVCIYHGIYPFGDQCFLHIDMYHQYCPFTTEFLNKLREGSSLMYSWNLGIGSDFIGLYAYYLASPMNWLIFLCPQNLVIEFMTLLILIKIGLCGFSFAYYLKKHYQTNSYRIVLFAVFYALCGFTCAYNWDIMWLDGVWLTPLIILGLERLVNEKKAGLYYVTLALSILSNYYISIMICIFIVIYYFILISEKKEKKQFFLTSLRFGGYSLLAGGTSAVLLLPEIQILSVSGSGGISFPDTFEWYFGILPELARLCISVPVSSTVGKWPNIYSGCAVILLIFLYLMNQNIDWQKKLKRMLFLAFFVISFANNLLTFIWHGLDFPDGLPARQTFLFSFLLLVMCYEAVHYAKGNSRLQVGISLVLGMVFLGICTVIESSNNVQTGSLVITGILLGAYALIYLFYISKDKTLQLIGWTFAFVLVITESFVNLNATSVDVTSRTAYTKNLDAYEELTDAAAEENDGFYRIDKYNRLTKNESSLTGYPSATTFSSLMNISVADAYKALGMEGGKNYYCYNGATPLTSAMLSVKYLMTDSAMEESPFRSLADVSDGIYLYENKYTLPLGFVVAADLEERWDYEWGTPIEVQNLLAYALGAEQELFTPFDAEIETDGTTIYVEQDAYVMGYYTQKAAKTMSASYSGPAGSKIRSYAKTDHVYLLDFGWCEAGTTITVTSTDVNLLTIEPYALNIDSLNTAYERLSAQTMELDSYDSTQINGHIDLETAGNLVLSVAADEGWTIYVDGEETKAETFCDAFISIPLTEGSHTIELSYQTPGLAVGAGVSAGCVAIFIFCMVWKKRRNG